jgi:hypothetical protein
LETNPLTSTKRVETDANSCIFGRSDREVLDVNVEASQPVQRGTATGKFDAFGHALLTFPNQFMPRPARP